MISLDTNVLIRYLVQDDLRQYTLARRLIKDQFALGQAVIVTLLVILESEWVLRSAYKYAKPAILSTFGSLLLIDEIAIEESSILEDALLLWEKRSVNFANCLIWAKSRALGCDVMATFDVRASKLPGCVLLKA